MISRRLGDFELGRDERQAEAGRENECSGEHVDVSEGEARICGRALRGFCDGKYRKGEEVEGIRKDSGKYPSTK